MLNFEGDYWGQSYRKGLEYIEANDSRDSITIVYINSPGKKNYYFLDKKFRSKLKFKPFENNNDLDNSDYLITNFRDLTNYRDNIDNYKKSKQGIYPYNNEVYSVRIGEMIVIGLYKLE